MDISGYGEYYSDIYKTQDATTSSKVDYSDSSDEQLMTACKEFESYFVEQMFKEMYKTIDATESTSAATNSLNDFYQDSMIQEYATSATEGNGLGLAQMLFEQMKRNYGA